MLNRRDLLKATAAACGATALGGVSFGSSPKRLNLHIGSCSINFKQAKQAGLEGVEVKAGVPAERLEIADPAVQEKCKAEMKETGLVIPSIMMSLLNQNGFAIDPRAPAWIEQTIDGAKVLGAKTILVAAFGKTSLLDENRQLKKADVDVTVERLKAAAPRAKAAGVSLALENILNAQQNAEIIERVGSDAVKVYYDVGNTTNQGYDAPAEIRFLKDRIASFHFKDNPHFLGEGKVPFEAVADAMREINYSGWIILETNSPSKDPVADAKRNAEFIRKLFGMS
jgi:L-ribulose-5-phosphate 3-epimerase